MASRLEIYSHLCFEYFTCYSDVFSREKDSFIRKRNHKISGHFLSNLSPDSNQSSLSIFSFIGLAIEMLAPGVEIEPENVS